MPTLASKLAARTQAYPLYSQSEAANPRIIAKLFDAY
jgi:hypothetical protein